MQAAVQTSSLNTRGSITVGDMILWSGKYSWLNSQLNKGQYSLDNSCQKQKQKTLGLNI